MSVNRIVQLGSLIAIKASDIDSKLTAAGVATPSFKAQTSVSNFASLEEIAESRVAILEATDELHSLLLGPVGQLTSHSHEIFLSLQAIYRFRLANCLPSIASKASFQDISQRAGLPTPLVRRVLRHAMTYRIFCEPEKGIVAHTGASQYLATHPLLHDWLGMVLEEMWPAASKTVDAMAKWPTSEEPNHSGFNLAHQTNQSAFQRLTSHVDSRARYEAAMQWFHADPGLRADHILCGYPWRSIPEQTVVDVGGSHGAIGIAIAEAYPTLRLIVQDQADVVQAGSARLPLDLKSRVSFMIHDFLESQPVGYAAVYILRWVLHDWSDAYATKILKALRPALKRGAAILICELIMPEPGTVSMYEARSMRSMDMAMLEFHNGKERDREDWVNLLQRADERFCIVNVRQPPGSRLSFIEVRWDVQSNGPGHQEDGTL